MESEDLGQRALGLRLANLVILDWEVWALNDVAATDVIETRPDATVLDLGGFSTPDQQLVIALSVPDDLWERRESRRPRAAGDRRGPQRPPTCAPPSWTCP